MGRIFYLAAILVAALTMPATGQEDANELLIKNASIAGSARYCKVETDLVEEFISKTEARLAYMSKDTYEKVISKIDFKNMLDAASGREPEGGCGTFEKKFMDALRQLP